MRTQGKQSEILKDLNDFFDKQKTYKDYKEDQKYVVFIKKKSTQRTLDQNALFHVLFDIIREEEAKIGNFFTREEIKEMMKKALIGVKEIGIGKFKTEVSLKGTSDLSIQEGIDFVEKILYFLDKHYGIKIENSEDKRLLEYYDRYIYGEDK